MDLFRTKEGRVADALERIAAALEVLAFHRRPSSEGGEDVSAALYVDDEYNLAMELSKDMYALRTGIRLREDEKLPEVSGKEKDESS